MDSIFACKLAFELDAFDSNGRAVAYHSSAANQNLLEQIYQHGCYTDELLLVWGEDGSGKTCLLQALGNIIHSDALVLKLDAGLDMDAESFSNAYQQALQVHMPADNGQFDDGREQWLLIDNAEQLQTDAIKYLTDVVALPTHIKVCLFSRDIGKERIYHSISNTLYQDFHLQAVSQADLPDYLRTRLLAAGLSEGDIELDEDLLNRIYSSSLGIPSAVNKIAKEALRRSLAHADVTEGEQNKKATASWMTYTVAAVGVLFLTLGALWVLYQPNKHVQENRVSEQLPPARIAEVLLEARGDDTHERKKSLSPPSEVLQRLKQAVDNAPNNTNGDGWLVSETAPKQQENLPENDQIDDAANQQAAGPRVQKQAADLIEKESSPLPAGASKPDLSKPNTETKTAPPKPSVARDLPNDGEVVLMALDKRHYVLQLAGARNLSSLKQFRQNLPAQYRGVIYRRSLKNKPWFVLVFGDFASRDAARSEIKRLSASLQSQRPWIKPVADIQAEIRSYLRLD